MREESVNFETTKNIFIEGDNLDALKLLQESYLGKIKLIYIDPPYNTGNDFIYKDNFAQSTAEYLASSGQADATGARLVANTESNGRFHSDWLSMMYPRLKLARNLLVDDGLLIASIDYRENFNLRLVLNEIFGSANFVGEIYWESKTKSQNTEGSYNKLQPKIEVMLVYSRGGKSRFNLLKKSMRNYPENDSFGSFRWAEIEQMSSGGVRGRKTMVFPILDVYPAPGRQWKFGQKLVNQWILRGDLEIRGGKPFRKMRPGDERSDSTSPFWGFFPKDIGTAESAKLELTKLLGKHCFDTVKPVALLQRLIYHMTSKGDIILDFFAGSGTAAHAVLSQNFDDGGNRQFIMVQLGENPDSKLEAAAQEYTSIAELSRERIRRAGAKILASSGEATSGLDIGFRSFKVASTNMADVFTTPDVMGQLDLDVLASSIKPGRTAEDVLVQVMLDWGLKLSLPIAVEALGGHTVHSVDDDALLACFDTDISMELIRAMAERQPLRAVFRDDAFETDAERINAEQIFKQLSPVTDVKVI